MIEKMKNEGMLERIDLGNVPNYIHVDHRFKSLPYDENEEYSVAYMWGTVGILYNTDMVDGPVDSWEILWDDKYAGQIFMYDSQRDAFAPALKKLGFSLNTIDIGELNQAKAELIRQRPLVQAYLGDPVKDKMIGGEGALAVVYSGDAMYSIAENEAWAYVIPREGSNLWCDAAVILKGAKNKENAEAFINFLCDPGTAYKNTMYVGYSTTNTAALDMLPDDMRYDDVYWPSDEELENCEVFVDLGGFIAEYDKAWTEVLSAAK
jgi:spermidine/putrescine transport system substrate-binding protein